MKLPIYDTGQARAARQTVAFRGINWSEMVQEGDLRDSIGLSTDLYPVLSQRTDRVTVPGFNEASDVFCWGSSIFVVDGAALKKDGEDVTTVTPGKKQWAVVNSKLVVFPDKVMVDLKTGKVEHMNMAATAAGNSTILTDQSITAQPVIKVASHVQGMQYTVKSSYFTSGQKAFYTYGHEQSNIKSLWDPVNRTWQGLDANPYRKLTGAFASPYAPTSGILPQQSAYQAKELGDFYIPAAGSFAPVWADSAQNVLPDESQYNTEGYYAVIVDFGEYIDRDGDTRPADGRSGMMWVGTYDNMWCNGILAYVDVYQIQSGVSSFAEYFKAGDAVKITGTPYGICDAEKMAIKSIDGGTNTIYFTQGGLSVPSGTAPLEQDLSENTNYQVKLGSVYYKFRTGNAISGQLGLRLVLNGAKDKVQLWNEAERKYEAEYAVISSGSSASGDISFTLADYNASATEQITIQRDIPDLDFICESSNRLWGVNCEDNTIFASSLGLPDQMYDYQGVSTDSYAMAVGSEGRFTAICSYGNAVCCWKENQLIRIMGSYPAEYYAQEYDVGGVRQGCEKSLVTVNEVLYFLGRDGVYAYTGNVPTKISHEFGTVQLTDGVGGKYRDKYYLAAKAGETHQLLVYDPARGIWMKEDERSVDAMANMAPTGVLYFIGEGGVFRTAETETEMLEWLAEFVPVDENATTYRNSRTTVGLKHKGYRCIRLRLDMTDGSWVKVEVKEDRGPWHLVWTQAATRDTSVNIPLRIGRCDRFAVRLTGKGRTDIRSMVREFTVGSEV